MNDHEKNILIVEDDVLFAGYCENAVKARGWKPESVKTAAECINRLNEEPPHALLLDIFLPDRNGIEILNLIKKTRLPTVVIVMTGKGSIDMAVEAMRLGAFDFLEKPIDYERLQITIGNALRHQEITNKLQEYEKSVKRFKFDDIVGSSLVMQTLYRIIENVASSRASVFITGESGTGKELCARAIHNHGPRKERPFVAINCAAIPNDLMESEIFGHEKGSFSDASQFRPGAASLADGGTLFLDEVCDLDLDLQSKLLRFIQSGHIKRVGSDIEEAVDVRFICATNKDPRQEIRHGRLREDLFYRLHVVPIQIPPLRQRGADILLLARHFLEKYAKEEKKSFKTITNEAANALFNHYWPGNVRELQNVIQQTVVLNDGKRLSKEILPQPLANLEIDQEQISIPWSENSNTIVPLLHVEMEAIERAVAICNGNIKLAASLLEIDQSTIYRKRKKWQGNQAPTSHNR